MKSNIIKYLASAAVLLGVLVTAQAVPITGSINFSGNAFTDSPSSPPTVNDSTKVNTWQSVVTGAADGSFAVVASGTAATFAAPWSFNSGAIANFWQVAGFNFDLAGSAIVSQGGGFLSVGGTGTISGNSYDPTAGSWRFTMQDPSAANPSGGFSFTWSGATGALPDGGTTAILLGAALSALGLLRRKLA